METISMTREQFDALQRDIAAMKEVMSKREDAISKGELEKAVNDIIDRVHPREKKIMFAKADSEDNGTLKISFSKFLKLVANGDVRLKTVMSEGTASAGGYVVPEEYYDDIIYQVPAGAVAYPKAMEIPMSRSKYNIPRRLTDLSIYWVDEDATKTLSGITLERPYLELKKMAVIIPFTDELLEDNNVNLTTVIAKMVNEKIGLEKDRCILVGNADPFNGILYETGVNAVAQAGASLEFDDIVNLYGAIPENYIGTSEWYLNRTGLKLVMKLKDNNGNPIWSLPAPNVPATILGLKYNLSGQIPSNLGAGSETAILLADISKAVWTGRKNNGGLTVTISNSAVAPASGSISQNAFMQDETWYRFVLRYAQKIILPSICGKLTGVK